MPPWRQCRLELFVSCKRASLVTPVTYIVQSELLDARAAYAITGGTGGLGLLFAAWLAAGGARHIALWGRSGRATAGAQMEHLLHGPAQASINTHFAYSIGCCMHVFAEATAPVCACQASDCLCYLSVTDLRKQGCASADMLSHIIWLPCGSQIVEGSTLAEAHLPALPSGCTGLPSMCRASHSITCTCAITPQVVVQRADPTIAEEAGAALWQSASDSTRMAGTIHAAGTQVHACTSRWPAAPPTSC